MIILHAWHRGKHPEDNINRNIRAAYEVIDSDLVGDHEYYYFLKRYWGLNSFIIVEHDMEVQQHHLKELIECSHPLCAFAYLVHPVTTNIKWSVYAHREATKDNTFRWIEKNEEFADFFGLGLTKISLGAQSRVKNIEPPTPYYYLDHHLSTRFNSKNLKCHIHWPEVEHQHE